MQTTITIAFSPFIVAGLDLSIGASETFVGNGFECPLSGSGSGVFNGPMTGSAAYTRTAEVMVFAGSVTINGHGSGLMMTCNVHPTTVAPTASFTVDCQGSLS